MNLSELNTYEDALITQLRAHPILKSFGMLSDEKVIQILLQRRFHSLNFTPLYDVAIDHITSENARAVLRNILREEYPQNLPSHREDLVYDLTLMGRDRSSILNAQPTLATFESIKNAFLLFERFESDASEKLHDIRTMTIVRLLEEVMVAEEYRCFLPCLGRMGLSEKNSRFYWPHYLHDQKRAPLDETTDDGTHSDQLTAVLQQLLSSEQGIELCAHIEQQILGVKK